MLPPMKGMLAQINDEVMAIVDAVLPPADKRVIVECDGFRCLGFCDQNGRWKDAYNEQALPEVLSFKPMARGRR